MRADALRTLAKLAANDERIVFITGDLGYGVVEHFFETFPDRAFNAGVAEQNMVAMATGLASSGLIPYVYSIANFAALRPFEFIRNGPVVHQLPVRVIGVGGGMEYSNNGPTHFALEDVGVLRTLPDLMIVCPTDNDQSCAALEATYDHPGPIYFRLSKSDVPTVEGASGRWTGVGAETVRRGDGSVAILALGAETRTLPAIAERLRADGIDATAVAVSQVAPAPVNAILEVARTHRLLVTTEAHHIVGGLGSMVCEVVAEAGVPSRVLRLGPSTWPSGVVGSPAYLSKWAGLDAESVARRIATALAATADEQRVS